MSICSVACGLTRRFINIFLSLLVSPRFLWCLSQPIFLLLGRLKKAREIELQQLRKVLVIRLDEIGDLVLSTPFLRELRNNAPTAWITLVVKPGTYNLVEKSPYVNEIKTYAWDMSLSKPKRRLRALKFAIFHLWNMHYELAILPRWSVDLYQGSFLTYFSGAERRVAYSEQVTDLKQKWNKGYDKLFTDVFTDRSVKHEVEHSLDLIKFLGGSVGSDLLELSLDRADEHYAQSNLEEKTLNNNALLVGIGMGSLISRKNWPRERFFELISWLYQELDSNVLLLGDKNDSALGKYIEDHADREMAKRVINMIGQTTLRQAAALLGHCKLHIGNDSGLKHIAAAAGVPVIEISSWPKSGSRLSSNSPYRFSPWETKYLLVNPEKPVSPCREECVSPVAHCILEVKVEDVKEAVRKLKILQ